MNAITRRDMLRVSGLAPLAILATEFTQDSALAQSVGPSVVGVPSPASTADLSAYIKNYGPQIIAKAKEQTLSPLDLKRLSGQLNLLANQLATPSVESAKTQLIQMIQPSDCDFSSTPEFDALYQNVALHSPNMTRSEMGKLVTFSAEQISKGKELLNGNSLEWTMRSAADSVRALQLAPAIAQNSGIAPALYNPRLSHGIVRDGVYELSSPARLSNICWFGLTKAQTCNAINGLIAFGLYSAAAFEAYASSQGIAYIAAAIGMDPALLILLLGVAAGLFTYYAIFC